MNLLLRQENSSDYSAVAAMIRSAYENVDYSNHREHLLVERLRKSDAFIPRLSLVAEADHTIAGHILLTKIVLHSQGKSRASLALAPLSVAPEFQGKGVGSSLVHEAHRVAKELGYRSVTVLGPAAYYRRFGYEPMKNYGIGLPFEVREENCLVLSLADSGLADLTGKIEYSPAFLE